MTEKDTPLRLVQSWVKKIPGCYEDLEKICVEHTGTMHKAVKDYLIKKLEPNYDKLPNTLLIDTVMSVYADELIACWQWRKNKVIYSFDRELTSLLKEQAQHLFLTTTEEGDFDSAERLPVELLKHPPYPIIYLKAPGMLEGIDGFFYWIDVDLQILCLRSDMLRIIPATGIKLLDETVGECVRSMLTSINDEMAQSSVLTEFKDLTSDVNAVNRAMMPVFCAAQLMLYLIAQNADISDDQPYRKPRRVIQDRFKEVHSYSVGVRIGATIRSLPTLRNAGGGDGVEGSTGPRNGKRQLVLR